MVTERIVVPIPASTEIYVVLEKQAKQPAITATLERQAVSSSTTTEQLANWLAGNLRRFLAFSYNQVFCSPRLHLFPAPPR